MNKAILVLAAMLAVKTFTLAQPKPILIVTTDIGQDPDDQQSMIRLLHYADKFHLAGLIANADVNYAHESPVLKDSILHALIDIYSQIENRLRIHSPEFPSANYLHSIVKKGCAGNGVNLPLDRYVGEGKDTEASQWIINIVDHSAHEPVNIAVWGGACDLAQALWKVQKTRIGNELAEFVSKLRVYFIGKQDSSNDWILNTFPDLWVILSQAYSGNSWESTYRGMFLGGNMQLTSREWLEANVLKKNPLTGRYPTKAYTGNARQNPYGAMKEGDSPAFLYFVQNGLNCIENPAWGGWGGRYSMVSPGRFRDSPDSVYDEAQDVYLSSTLGSVYRWRADFQRDFAARAQWGASDRYADANHYPIIHIMGYPSSSHIEISAQVGETLYLNAAYSFDPDLDSLAFDWFFYPEAGSFPGSNKLKINGAKSSSVHFTIPENASGKHIHLILRLTDNNTYPMSAYKRVVVQVR